MIIRWLLSALTLLAASYLLPGFHVSSFYAALITALALGLVNIFIRPLILLVTLPINILTLGLFTFVINASLLMLVSTFVKGFQIDSFVTALMAALLLWLMGMVVDAITGK